MKESVLRFGPGQSLVGVIAEPAGGAPAAGRPAVLLLNAGLISRVGPQRFYVKLARLLARAGCVVLRFDISGIGDSAQGREALEESGVEDTRAAMDALGRRRGVGRFILAGICSGARIARLVAVRDPRVCGLALVDGIYVDDDLRAALAPAMAARVQQRYYRKKLFRPESWWRVIRGRSSFRGIGRALRARLPGGRRGADPPPHAGSSPAFLPLAERGVALLLVYAEGSMSWDFFCAAHRREVEALAGVRPILVFVPDCDHVFTPLWSQERLARELSAWVLATRDRHEAPAATGRAS